MGVVNITSGYSVPELSIVIPFYNEETCCIEVLSRIVTELDHSGIDYELLPVNNGSTDQTGALLANFSRSYGRIRIVTVQHNEGYGWGILSGLKQCTGFYTGYMDGDAQIAPGSLLLVFARLKVSGADLCKATRATRFDGWKRKTVSRIYNTLFRILFLCPVTDINAKPKIMRQSCVRDLNLDSKDWFIDAELMLKAQANNLLIEEVEIEFLPRKQGASKVKLSTLFEFTRNIARYYFFGRKKGVAPSRSARQSLHV